MRSKWQSYCLSLSFGLILCGCATAPLTPTQQQLQTLQIENTKLKSDLQQAENDLSACMELVKDAIPEVDNK